MLDRAETWSPEPTHEDNLQARMVRVDLLTEIGSLEQATNTAETLLPDLHNTVGDDHPDTLRVRSNLARFLGEAGRVDDAIVALEEVLVDRRRVLGDDHPDTLKARNYLASLLGRKPLVKSSEERIGRNSPCHCGSGKKFKRCHGRP